MIVLLRWRARTNCALARTAAHTVSRARVHLVLSWQWVKGQSQNAANDKAGLLANDGSAGSMNYWFHPEPPFQQAVETYAAILLGDTITAAGGQLAF